MKETSATGERPCADTHGASAMTEADRDRPTPHRQAASLADAERLRRQCEIWRSAITRRGH